MEVPFLCLKDVTSAHGAEINDAVCRVINRGWYLQGEELECFETEYARYIGTKHCIGVANGLEALSLIIRAYIELGVFKEGDEIIVPSNTYIASILAISENGLAPVLVEPNIFTYEIDDSKIEEAIGPKTKGIMIVHLYGKCAYTEKIKRICYENNLILMEDNAQAHGCRFGDSRTGSLGDAAGHSFYPGKNLGAVGDAGAITTDDDDLEQIIRAIANYGSSKKYVFDYKGVNSRLDEIQAAVLRVKLRYLDEDNRKRVQIANKYIDSIQNDRIILPPSNTAGDNVYHVFPVRCSSRDNLQKYLMERGINTLIHYPIPPHKQRAFSEWNEKNYPISEEIHDTELSLPMSPTLQIDQVEYVIDMVNGY